MNYEFTVTGMTCGHCEKAVTKAVQKQDPEAQVLIYRDQNLVQISSTKERETLRQAIVEEGYAVASWHASSSLRSSSKKYNGPAKTRPTLQSLAMA